MSSYNDETRLRVCYGKPVLCEGEAAKVVVEIPEGLRGVGGVLALLWREGGETTTRPDDAASFGVLTPRRHRDGRVYFETAALAPGEHALRVYFMPSASLDAIFMALLERATFKSPLSSEIDMTLSVRREEVLRPLSRLETYLVEEQRVYVAPREAYAAEAREMFGDSWDEPIYLDSLSVERLNELFDGWSLRRPRRWWLLRQLRPEEGYDYGNVFVHSVRDIVGAFIGNEVEGRPFELSAEEVSGSQRLPRVDLSKFMWLLSVLSPTWAHLLLGHERVSLSVGASDSGLALRFFAPDAEREPRADKEYSTEDEPPLFRIVRESVGDSLAMNLSYHPVFGVRLEVSAEAERESAPYEYLNPPSSEPGQEFPPATI